MSRFLEAPFSSLAFISSFTNAFSYSLSSSTIYTASVETTVVHPIATGNFLGVKITHQAYPLPSNAYSQYRPSEAQLRHVSLAVCVQTTHGGMCMLIEMRRHIQDWWYKQRARLRSRLQPTGGGLSAAKTSSWGMAFVNAPKFTPCTSHAAYVKTAHMRRVPQSTRVRRFAL